MAGRELLFAIRIAGRLDGSLGAAVNSAQAQLNRLSRGANKIGNALTLGVAMAGAKVLKDSIETYKGYETAVNSAAAVYNVAKGTFEYDQLAEAARQVGRETVKSAQEGANALEYMGLAGWSVEKSTKALIPVVKLSAATGMDLATTSDLVTDTMAAMGIGIDSVGHYLDVLAKGNNSANYTSQMLLESLANVGGVFRSLNVGVEDGAAVLGILANQGTKGATAGTQLNTVLTRMQKLSGESFKGMQQLGLSMFDAEGNTRNIIDVFGDMYEATKNMTDEQRNQVFTLIGGTRGYRALTKIMSGFTDTAADGTPIIRSLAAAYRDADGSLENFYDIKTDTMEGALARLQRLYEDMGIGIGEALAPNLNSLIKHLSAKMPEISDVITGVIEESAPPVMEFLDYIIDNSDKIIDSAVGFAKTWTKIKVGSAATRELGNMLMLGNNLIKLAETKGVSKMLTTIGTGLTGLNAAALPVTGTILGVAAAIAVYNKVRRDMSPDHRMEFYSDAMGKATEDLIKYNNLAQEVSQLKMTIGNPESSVSEINAAQQRLSEIAEMLGVDYNLNIHADTTEIDDAIEKMKSLSTADLIDEGDKFLTAVGDAAGSYAKNFKEAQSKYAEAAEIDKQINMYETAWAQAQQYLSAYNAGGDANEFVANMRALQELWQGRGLDLSAWNIQEPGKAIDMISAWKKSIDELSPVYTDLMDKADSAQKKVDSFNTNTSKGTEYLSEALASYAKVGDVFGMDKTSGMLKELGGYMTEAGVSTDALGRSFISAIRGTTDFNTALGVGGTNAQAMAQDYINFKDSIGAASDETVSGAALIANGFQDASAAAAAGSNAINAVIADMASLGSQQGVFDGMDIGGVADKLSDMAHAMNLIPESKSISLDANGNFGVIQEAENQIASLKSIGNVDVSVNADGDVSVLDEAGNKIQEFQALGAVDLAVNAEGNIDVLNEAQEVLATIDQQSGQVEIKADANVTPGEVNAEGFIERVFDFIMGVSPVAAAEMMIDANVTTGNVNVSGFQQGVTAAAQGAAAQNGNVDTTMNATVNAGSVNTAPFAQSVQSQARSILDGFGGIDANASANITINAQDNASGALQAAASAASSLPQNASISITANDGASGPLQAAAGAANSIPQSVYTSLSAGGNAESMAVATTAAIQAIPQSHNTVLSASGNALSMAQSVASAIAAIPTSKTVTISVRQTRTAALTAPFEAAHGIRNAPGGLYMVNDQNISDPRELIEYKGRRFWYEGRNVTTVLPRGANVYPAAQSKAFINGSHKSGLARVPFDGYIAELHRNERVLTSREAADYEPDPVGRRLRALDGVDRGQNNSAYTASGGDTPMSVTFSPTYVVQGNADEKTLRQTAKMSHRDFENYMKEYEKNKRRKSFAT